MGNPQSQDAMVGGIVYTPYSPVEGFDNSQSLYWDPRTHEDPVEFVRELRDKYEDETDSEVTDTYISVFCDWDDIGRVASLFAEGLGIEHNLNVKPHSKGDGGFTASLLFRPGQRIRTRVSVPSKVSSNITII